MCKKCCKAHAIAAMLDCPGHHHMIKSHADKRAALAAAEVVVTAEVASHTKE